MSAAVLAAQNIEHEATVARESNRLEDAIRLYRQAVAENPSWTEGWWYLATLLYDQDDYSGAASAFNQAVALDPKSTQTRVMLGLSEAKLGRNAEALEHLREGRQLGVPADSTLVK